MNRLATSRRVPFGWQVMLAGAIAAAGAVPALGACGRPREPGAARPPAIQLSRPADRATVRIQGDAVVVTIDSATGIGQADLGVAGRRWPRSVIVRIRGLTRKQLEGFTAANERLRMHSAAGRPWPETRERDARGAWRERVEDRRFRLEIRLRAAGDRYEAEVALPAALLTPAERNLRVEWVDAHRG